MQILLPFLKNKNKNEGFDYLDKEKCGNRRQIVEIWIVKGIGRMVWHVGRDAENFFRRIRRPIGRSESESVVSSTIHWSNLKNNNNKKVLTKLGIQFKLIKMRTLIATLSTHWPSMHRLKLSSPTNQSGEGTIRDASDT